MALSEKDKQSIESLLNRKPTQVEESIFDTMWSEHCSYKSSKPVLKTLPVKGSEVALGVGEDAGIIRFVHHEGKSYCIAVSHESHNHPSQILPVEGAATGVGGCVRDVYCMGADVFGVLNSLHFGMESENPIVEEIAEKVVAGIADYGNPLGVPVLGGETLYHPSYNDNCLVNVAALGLVEESKIIHSYVPEDAKTVPYDIILFGKSTDATGFGGASFSSATLDSDNQDVNLGAVQVHDPFLKRVLAEAIKVLLQEVYEKKIPIGFKDLGAGGISCATSEIASASGFGVEINLDLVNTAFADLPPQVIACSETQERFCLAVPRTFSERVLAIFNEQFELPKLYPLAGAAVIGAVIQEGMYRIWHKGHIVCNLPVQAITTEVRSPRTANPRPLVQEESVVPTAEIEAVKKALIQTFERKNNASKRYIYRYFDNAVRGDTIVYPGEADAVVVAPVQGCTAGAVVAMDSNLYGHVDPYVSGAAAVAESIRNVVAVGARPIALTDCLNYGNPEKPDVFFDFQQGVKGIKDAAEALNFYNPTEAVPIISGNVSFYNESKTGSAVVPSPVVLCIGKIEDYHAVCTMQLNEPRHMLFMIGDRYNEFAGTQIQPILGLKATVAPQVRLKEENAQNRLVHQLISKRLLSACHDVSMGGAWQALSEMVLGERGHARVGIDLELQEDKSLLTWMFSENGGYIVAVPVRHLTDVQKLLQDSEVYFRQIGRTTEDLQMRVTYGSYVFSQPVESVSKAWSFCNA